jgi:hypothetical protein
MTFKKELEYLSLCKTYGEEIFHKQIGIALRSSATDSKCNKIVDHFDISRDSIEALINNSYITQ